MATGSSEVARLGEKDLAELHRVLYPARNKCNFFGLQIGLGFDEIENIESNKTDSGDRLLAILSVRLNKAKPLTWNEIYSALRSKPVDKRRLAEEIRQKYGHLFITTESDSEQEHETKSEEIKKVKNSAPKTQKGGDHRARVSKRSSEYEGIETVRSKKHVQEVEGEDEEDSVLSRRKKELSKKGKRKGGKPAHDREKVHGKERTKGMNKKDKFTKDESHSEPEEVREMSKQKKKATHDREESVSDHNHHSDSEVCRKRVKKGSKRREVNIESESEASSDEEEMQRSSLEDDTCHKGSAKRKPVTKRTEMKVKVQKEHREDRKDTKYAKSRYSDEEVSTKSAQKLRRSKKFENESDEESSSASSSDKEEIRVPKHTDNSKHTETKSAAHSKDTTHFESEEKGKTSGKKRVSLKPQSATAVSPCPELYKDKRSKITVKMRKSVDSGKETYHKTSSKPLRNQREDQEEKLELVSGKKGTAPPLKRDLPSSEVAETDSGDGESDESSEDEEQKSSDEEEETEDYDCSPAEEKEEKGKMMSRHIKEKDQEKEVVSAKKETPPCLERDLPSSEMAETDSGDGESDESSEDEEQKSSDEEEETEYYDCSPAEEKEEKGKMMSRHIKEKDQEEKKEVVSAKKETPPCLERDLPSSEMAETDSGDGESDESSEDEEQKSSDEEEETEYYDCSPAEEKEEKGKIMSRHIKEKEKKEVVSAKKETAPPLERDLPSSEMAETDSGDGESDESSEDENESEQKSSDEEEETEKDDGSSVEEKEKKGSEKSTLTTTTDMQKTKSQDDDENSKQKKLSKALSKDDYKEGSDPGGSREQKDQPKKRNRRRHRESSKTPIVRGGSSPSSSQEERKKRKKRGRDHKMKSDRKKKRKGDKDGATGTDDSSPECDMVNQSEVEKKELASVFERFYGKLCCVEFDPKIIAAQLQEKALISKVVMKEMIISPESQQAKIISLIDALDEMIKSHPERFFPCIEVMLKNMDLQELGTRMLSEAGKKSLFVQSSVYL